LDAATRAPAPRASLTVGLAAVEGTVTIVVVLAISVYGLIPINTVKENRGREL
jgi:hypothetical protein